MQPLRSCARSTAPEGTVVVKLYLLSYEGYHSHWDEWVPESRVLKDDKVSTV